VFNDLLVKPLFNLLAYIYAVLPLHDFGLAVIVLTIIIRIVLWPLVNKQLHSQRAIQKLQPEMARIKKEAAGDRQKESQMVMELYKEKEISPLAPMLPLLIQMPVLIALFVVLKDIVVSSNFAKLSYDFVASMGAIAPIIHGTTKFVPSFFGLVDLAKPALVFALTAAATQFYQTRQIQPKQQATDAQAQTMNAMIYVFPVLTLFIGLSLPGALALFWTVTSLVAIFQQHLILKKDVEDLEKGGKK